ncbi:S8 family serine peptidase [Cytobacillus purgationiresistens]|uniref:Subtilisin family serine protease n=1 Tax=Cytobacillus purgationiresistens TaxID=863449 RepID=A0ABU0AGF1_9BACI|nr:S8 family serine peptidase [Cytobacillus purgationiresistens]MDQ0270342.1 subtilisin family serine protease [Cytobacillus purgationiresistens]
MKRERKNTFRWINILMIAFLIVSMMFSSVGSAEGKKQVESPLITKSATEATGDKISKSLTKEFDKKDKITFLIKFKEKANPAASAKKAEKAASTQKQTAAQAIYMKRSAIIADLKTTAIEAQGEVTDFVEKQEESGQVTGIQSFYIVNAMAVTATEEVMEKIAAFPEVEKILPNKTMQLHTPAKTEEASNVKKAGGTNSIEWNIDHIGAPAVWEMGIDGSGTVVASIDSGVQGIIRH